jgi:hypothetical protein
MILPLALLGAGLLGRRSDAGDFRFSLLLGWMLAGMILGHLPFLSAYKFLFLLHVPLCICATEALVRWGPRWRWWLLMPVVPVLSLTNFRVVIDSLGEVAEPSKLFYMPRAEYNTLRALAEFPPGNVLASPVTGAFVPWLSRKPVYVGQWFLTIDPEVKWQRVKKFFDPETSTSWRREFLVEHQIRYLIYGPAEKKLGPLDATLPLVALVNAGGLTVFEVIDESLP